MNEYDLKKSEKIGQLYPVLVDAKGNVIDGVHRLEADPNWRKEKLTEVDTEEKLLVARCVANWHRRQVAWEEKEEWINGLARIYKKQGLEVYGKRMGSAGASPNKIRDKIAVVTGLTPDTVNEYLSEEFKQTPRGGGWSDEVPRLVPASQVIEKSMGNYGKRLVERHREEVLSEESPRIEREVREKIIEEEIKPKIKEELSRDAEFIKEAIEKAPEVLPTLPEKTIERAKKAIEPLTKEMGVKEGTVYTVGEYECPHCKKHYVIKCNGKRDWVE